MKPARAAALMGLAQKAGRVAAGEAAAQKAIRGREAALVILSTDASANTKKKFMNMAQWYQVPICRYLSKEELGRCIGKSERSCAVILDSALAERIEKQINRETMEQTGKVVENSGKYQNP